MMVTSTRGVGGLAALALALFVCACAPTPTAAEWKFCAPEGGHCHCFGEMRFGHPGMDEHHADGGKFFEQHPEVKRWNTIQTKGAQVECAQKLFGGEEEDPFPSALLGQAVTKFCQCNKPEERVWKHCAEAGGTCTCAGASDDEHSALGKLGKEGKRQKEEHGDGGDGGDDKPAKPHATLVRATDKSGAYYGVQSVKDVFTCPADYPGASCECLSVPDEPEMKWDWCANEGGHCPCETKMRYGATGTNEMYTSGYFKENPDVKKWVEKDIIGDVGVTKCDASKFDGVDPFPDQKKICQCMMPVRKPEEKVLAWKWCANEGGECDCQTAARFGNTGDPDDFKQGYFAQHPEVKKWHIRGDAPGKFSCSANSFNGDGEDPFPGRSKICQCLTELPRSLSDAELIALAVEVKHKDWSWCGDHGSRCKCDGLVRYGATGEKSMYENDGQWFKDHPEVMKWTYLKSYDELECSHRTFGFDPFPDQKKICQCYDGFNEEFPYQTFRPVEASLGGPGGRGAVHRPVVAQVIDKQLSSADDNNNNNDGAAKLILGGGGGAQVEVVQPAQPAQQQQQQQQADVDAASADPTDGVDYTDPDDYKEDPPGAVPEEPLAPPISATKRAASSREALRTAFHAYAAAAADAAKEQEQQHAAAKPKQQQQTPPVLHFAKRQKTKDAMAAAVAEAGQGMAHVHGGAAEAASAGLGRDGSGGGGGGGGFGFGAFMKGAHGGAGGLSTEQYAARAEVEDRAFAGLGRFWMPELGKALSARGVALARSPAAVGAAAAVVCAAVVAVGAIVSKRAATTSSAEKVPLIVV